MEMPNLYYTLTPTTAFRTQLAALQKAKLIMQQMKLTSVNIHGTKNVTGSTSDTYVVVTFIQIDSTRFEAIAMASGTSAQKLVGDFQTRLKNVERIDY